MASSNARWIGQLATERPDEVVFRHIALDGGEAALTWPQLDTRSSQLGGALAARGLSFGDILGLGLRNSPEFVLSVFAAWKLGAVPVPVRWDVPDWELARLREVIAPRIYLSPADVPWIDATARLGVPDLPDVVSPQVNGICSSGSTGTPKVILVERPAVYEPRLAAPYMAMWRPVARPQTILVLAPMYHINGFSTLHSLLAGDRLVVMEKFDAARVVDVIERHRISTFTGSVGRGALGTELRILDGEDTEVPTGEIGEIYLRSPFYGGYRYLGGAPRMRQTEDGFATAGDLGYLDADGFLYLVDRRIDVIITGGANVFPAEVEAALIDHPDIADVVVVGLSDPEWGRRVHAIIEPADHANPPTTDDVISYAKSRIAPYKVPKTVEIVSAIPRSEATKVNRGALVAARGG